MDSPRIQQSQADRAASPDARVPAELAVIVPTLNESGNVLRLIARLERALAGMEWEVVFVDDDSIDGTIALLEQAAAQDSRIRLVRRIGRRGLSSAVVEGALSTNAPLIAVMDADLQHDDTQLPLMKAHFADPALDLVIGSRYARGGDLGAWSHERRRMSRFATILSRLVIKANLTDPMSGFFMIRREAFDRSVRRLSSQGYKILLDIIASAPRPLAIKEIPYSFGQRDSGESKLDAHVTFDYAALLLDKTIGRVVPARFVMFSLVGAVGVLVHMSVLSALHQGAGAAFTRSQALATITAMTFNFFLNNWLTYRDQRLRGLGALTRGLLSFYAIGAIGAVANVGVASVLFGQNQPWFIAGIAGILVGAVWNYGVSAVFTWRRR